MAKHGILPDAGGVLKMPVEETKVTWQLLLLKKQLWNTQAEGKRQS